MRRQILHAGCLLAAAVGLLWACGFDNALREYLSANFWLPFAKGPFAFAKPGVRRISAPFAGMKAVAGDSTLEQLRAAYQEISQPFEEAFDPGPWRALVAFARADASLSLEDKEEIDLIDAKIDMRAGEPGRPDFLNSAKQKLETFLRTAKTPAFHSEARGWLAHVYYLLDNQTAAGKIYIDELNRDGSNLSRETIANSLRMTYGYDGGAQLRADLEQYFDTPEHAAFAIQLATNPRWDRSAPRFPRSRAAVDTCKHISALLEKYTGLLRSNRGADVLAILAMRTELRMGNPAAARRIAGAVPKNARVRSDPDFRWMLASACFLSHDYKAAEQPLLMLFRASRPGDSRKAAAAYALCGVFRKTGNFSEQLRFALWLRTAVREHKMYLTAPSGVEDLTVYWAVSGWDLNLLLEAEAPIDALQAFIQQNPALSGLRLVKYSLAVRLARENRYEDAAEMFDAIGAFRRGSRMERLAALFRDANRPGLAPVRRQEAWFKVAEFLQGNADRVYFNHALWSGLQRYAMEVDSSEARMTRVERDALHQRDRNLKDEQEERWRAYLILRGIVAAGDDRDLARRAARLAIRCLRGINTDRFGRAVEIHKADVELSSRFPTAPAVRF